MASKELQAQQKVMTGSFVVALITDGDLVKDTLHRVQHCKDSGKYVIIDTKFCGTDALNGKTLKFEGRFRLLEASETKRAFRKVLTDRQFKSGQEFLDVRTGEKFTITDSSRTHLITKFGKIIGLKIASGHAWFAGAKFAKGMIDLEVLPEDSTPEEVTPTIPKEGEYAIHIPTKSEAVVYTNIMPMNGGSKERWLENWEPYQDQTVYVIRDGKIDGYGDLAWASDQKMTIVPYDEWYSVQFPEEKEEQPTKKQSRVKATGSLEEQIFAIVEEHLDSDESRKYMADNVETLLNTWGIDKNVRQLEVKVNDKEVVKVGKVHYMYDLVLKCMIARTNVALVGPAGSGKTTTVAKAAQALELEFYSKSVSAQTGVHEFFGYQDAQGRYVRTLFREAYENGGVFLLDEFDAGNANVLAALNQATANDHCAFADGMIPKHKDFICVMAGNTFGHGANSEYVGRNKIDAATLDRFAFIDFPYDEDLEHALATNKQWCKKVQKIRKKVSAKKIKTVVSPRATIIGCQLLDAGVSEKEVMELVIFKGLNQEERNLLIG